MPFVGLSVKFGQTPTPPFSIMDIKNIILSVLIFGLLLGIIYMTYAASVIAHENAHKAINKYFGVDSTIEYNNFGLGGITYPQTKFENKSDRDAAYIAHGVNEAVGYQTIPWFFGIMALQVIIISFLLFGVING